MLFLDGSVANKTLQLIIGSLRKGVSRVSCLFRIQFRRIAVFRIPSRPHWNHKRKFAHNELFWEIFLGITEATDSGDFVTVWHSGALTMDFHNSYPNSACEEPRTVFILSGVAENCKLKFWNGLVWVIKGRRGDVLFNRLNITYPLKVDIYRHAHQRKSSTASDKSVWIEAVLHHKQFNLQNWFSQQQ